MTFSRRLASLALAGAAVLFCAPAVAHADRTITLTFVRHAESAGNAAGVIDTSVPGPDLTEQGRKQAQDAANELSANGYDGIYASNMIRTQETAAPLCDALGESVTVLPGLREIEAGRYEGQSVSEVQQYLSAPMAWLNGNRSARIPGSVNGKEFAARFDAAVQSIYDSGNVSPVAFSHSVATMVWVLMNVKNPDNSLLTDDPLPNVGHIVVVGSPRQGWTLTEWNGTPVAR